MNITIPYGTGTVSADIPEQIQTFLLDPSCPKLDGDDAARIEAALDAPIGTPRLEHMVTPANRVLIVVNDHTRPGPNQAIVAGLLKRLKAANVSDAHIRFIVATGSHRAPTPEELAHIVGAEVAQKYEIISHDCRDKARLFCLGKVQELEICLNKALI